MTSLILNVILPFATDPVPFPVQSDWTLQVLVFDCFLLVGLFVLLVCLLSLVDFGGSRCCRPTIVGVCFRSSKRLIDDALSTIGPSAAFLGQLFPFVASSEPRWLAPSAPLSTLQLKEGENLTLLAQSTVVTVTNLVQRESLAVDLLEPLRSHVRHIARLFKLAPEHVALFTNGKQIDLGKPLRGQPINVVCAVAR